MSKLRVNCIKALGILPDIKAFKANSRHRIKVTNKEAFKSLARLGINEP